MFGDGLFGVGCRAKAQRWSGLYMRHLGLYNRQIRPLDRHIRLSSILTRRRPIRLGLSPIPIRPLDRQIPLLPILIGQPTY